MMDIFAYAGHGYEGSLVHVEVDLRRGIPGIEVVGLPDNAVREARQRVRAGIRNSGFTFPLDRILINLAPAGVKKGGASFDLPIAISLLLASGQVRPGTVLASGRMLILGELELSGRVRSVRGTLAAMAAAKSAGITHILVPSSNVREAASSALKVAGIEYLSELSDLLSDTKRFLFQPEEHGEYPTEEACIGDFSDIKGSSLLRRALEIAAAGRHHLLLFGPPGSGKTMSIDRYPSILPDLDLERSLEVTRIHSLDPFSNVSGTLMVRPPVRRPHHSATREGLIGGEKENRPGEVALAHEGVLFLDEALEFRESLLQSLREPIERGRVDISRSGSSYWFPTRFQLILATNVCPCGRLGRPDGGCGCTEKEVARYWRKVGAALMDRIDIRVPCSPLAPELFLGPPGEGSRVVRERVRLARDREERRNREEGVLNGFLPDAKLHRYCVLDREAGLLFSRAVERFAFSSRASASLLRVGRTIADLDGKENIDAEALCEAVAFRRFGDRDLFWCRL